jgi:uncharacterized protein
MIVPDPACQERSARSTTVNCVRSLFNGELPILSNRLVLLLANASIDSLEPAFLSLRYALTAVAMDWEVELDVIGAAGVPLLRRADPGLVSPDPRVTDLQARLREACEHGVQVFVCPAALAQAGMTPAELMPEATGIRGAAALLVSGFAPQARMMTL